MRPVMKLLFCMTTFGIADMLLGHANGHGIQVIPLMTFNMSGESVATAKVCKCSMEKCLDMCCKAKCHSAYMYSSSCNCYCGIYDYEDVDGDVSGHDSYSGFCPKENFEDGCVAQADAPWATTTPDKTDECFHQPESDKGNPCVVECNP